MERMQKKAGVPAVVGILAIVIILYSLWGASLLRAQDSALSKDSAHSVATNL